MLYVPLLFYLFDRMAEGWDERTTAGSPGHLAPLAAALRMQAGSVDEAAAALRATDTRQIHAHLIRCYPEEGCGVLVDGRVAVDERGQRAGAGARDHVRVLDHARGDLVARLKLGAAHAVAPDFQRQRVLVHDLEAQFLEKLRPYTL